MQVGNKKYSLAKTSTICGHAKTTHNKTNKSLKEATLKITDGVI